MNDNNLTWLILLGGGLYLASTMGEKKKKIIHRPPLALLPVTTPKITATFPKIAREDVYDLHRVKPGQIELVDVKKPFLVWSEMEEQARLHPDIPVEPPEKELFQALVVSDPAFRRNPQDPSTFERNFCLYGGLDDVAVVGWLGSYITLASKAGLFGLIDPRQAIEGQLASQAVSGLVSTASLALASGPLAPFTAAASFFSTIVNLVITSFRLEEIQAQQQEKIDFVNKRIWEHLGPAPRALDFYLVHYVALRNAVHQVGTAEERAMMPKDQNLFLGLYLWLRGWNSYANPDYPPLSKKHLEILQSWSYMPRFGSSDGYQPLGFIDESLYLDYLGHDFLVPPARYLNLWHPQGPPWMWTWEGRVKFRQYMQDGGAKVTDYFELQDIELIDDWIRILEMKYISMLQKREGYDQYGSLASILCEPFNLTDVSELGIYVNAPRYNLRPWTRCARGNPNILWSLQRESNRPVLSANWIINEIKNQEQGEFPISWTYRSELGLPQLG